MQRVGRRRQPKGFLRLRRRLSFGFAFSFDFTSFALVAFFFVHVVVAFALALFVGFSCCCFFHSPSRLSDFQVMSFFCCPPLGWTVLLMDCCQVKVMSYVGVSPCVCASVCECAGMWVWGRALFILQGLLSKSPRLRPAHKASHEIQFVSIICLIFIR